MKELFIMRHGKSDWGGKNMSDFDRPLNKRGKSDVSKMGEYLKSLGIVPDLILSSPAKRAKKTAQKVAERIGYDENSIRWTESIYEASAQTLLYIVCQLPENAKRVILVGHNPSLTYLANLLGDITIDNIPTSGVLGIAFDAKSWNEVCQMKGHVTLFETPKKLEGKR